MKHFSMLLIVGVAASIAQAQTEQVDSGGKLKVKRKGSGSISRRYEGVANGVTLNKSRKDLGGAGAMASFAPNLLIGARIDAKAGKLVFTMLTSDCNHKFGMLQYRGSNKAKFGPHHYGLIIGSTMMSCKVREPRKAEFSVDIPQDRQVGDRVIISVNGRFVQFTVKNPLEDQDLKLNVSSTSEVKKVEDLDEDVRRELEEKVGKDARVRLSRDQLDQALRSEEETVEQSDEAVDGTAAGSESAQ